MGVCISKNSIQPVMQPIRASVRGENTQQVDSVRAMDGYGAFEDPSLALSGSQKENIFDSRENIFVSPVKVNTEAQTSSAQTKTVSSQTEGTEIDVNSGDVPLKKVKDFHRKESSVVAKELLIAQKELELEKLLLKSDSSRIILSSISQKNDSGINPRKIDDDNQAYPESAEEQIFHSQVKPTKMSNNVWQQVQSKFGAKPMENKHAGDEIYREAQSRIGFFLMRQDDDLLKRVFDRHSDQDKKLLSKKNLKNALLDVGFSLQNEEVEDLLSYLETENHGTLSYPEFKRASLHPSKVYKELERWTASIPFSQLVAAAFTAVAERGTGKKEPLRSISKCSDDDYRIVCDALTDGILQLCKQHGRQVREAYDILDKKKLSPASPDDQSKFTVNAMSCGSISAFYDGLGSRVGFPSLQFMEAMEKEHRSKTKFTTPNYGMVTCPADEWRIVTECDLSFEKEHNGQRRRIPSYAKLFKTDQGKPESQRAGLTKDEIIAIILYTDPMYVIYNMVLRRWPKDLFDALNGNMFSTTIHCLVSGVTKISRVTKLGEGLLLYRGFGGLSLPDQFYKAPESGYKGFVEWGFMSTTSDKAVAIEYTGIAKGRLFPTLLQVRPAAVDHGGDISEYSQFPGEREYLWNPCSLLESNGEPVFEVTKYGIITIIPVRMNNNVKTMTVEQLLEQKKRMHISGFEFLVNEVKFELTRVSEERMARGKAVDPSGGVGLLQWIVEGIVEECQATLKRHRDVSPQDYIDDEVFRKLVIEMLESKSHALSKVRLCREALAHMGGDGLTPLMLAAGKGDTARVKELIVDGADVRAQNKSNRTALHEASSPDVLRVLLDYNSNVNAKDSAGCTVLRKAAEKGNVDAIRVLLEFKADIDDRDSQGRSGLHGAAENGHIDVVRVLIQARADISAVDNRGMTPLDVSKDDECCDTLKGAGADGWTPLIFAGEMGGEKLENYFRCRQALLCIVNQSQFPEWFMDMVRYYENLKNLNWSWGAYESSSVTISSNGLTVRRSSSSPDYSCALGSFDFDDGIHAWTIRVENVTSMWMGIARGVAEAGGLGSYPGVAGKYMIAFSNSSGDPITMGRSPCLQRISNTSFTSGQLVSFELDMSRHVLKMSVNGRLALIATNIDDKGVSPYVCMGYEESVTLETRTKRTTGVKGISSIENYQLTGFNNSVWTEEEDSALVNIPITGCSPTFVDVVPIWDDKAVRELEVRISQLEIVRSKDPESVKSRILVYATIKQLMANSVGRECFAIAYKQIVEGLDISTHNKKGTTPLHAVAKSGHLEILRLLLDEKADINAADNDGVTPLVAADNKECKKELKSMGADGWTALMIAVDCGPKAVEQYFNYREVYLCLRNRLPFPVWFRDMVQRFDNLRTAGWTWGAYEISSLNLSDDRLSVDKTNSSPDYSCAVGSLEFHQGIHTWIIQVENVRAMWLGIARGVEEKGGLGSAPGNEGDFMLVFSSSDGSATVLGDIEPVIERISKASFSSCQLIEFELNTFEHCLKVSIDGELAVIARNIDDKGVRPYVCMDYDESATIISRSFVASRSSTVSDEMSVSSASDASIKDAEYGWDNALWSEQSDIYLAALNITDRMLESDLQLQELPINDLSFADGRKASRDAAILRLKVLGAMKAMLLGVTVQDKLIRKVNGDGCPMSLGQGDGSTNLYCGRMLGVDVIPGTDGRCGPNNGNQCQSCEEAQQFRWRRSLDIMPDLECRTLRLGSAVKMLHAMIENDVDIDTRNKAGSTALLIAAEKGDEKVLLTLLAANADLGVDNSVTSVLDVTEKEKCSTLLKAVGADGWTPLMLAAEQGMPKIDSYFKFRELFLCVQNQKPFPEWFGECVQEFQRTLDTEWTWGPREPSSTILTSDNLKICKVNHSPDYSCGLGSCPFQDGIHKWAIRVDNVQSMWLGIARGVEEVGLGSAPGQEGDYILAFGSSGGDPLTLGRDPFFEFPTREHFGSENEEESNSDAGDNDIIPPFESGQLIEFELDMDEHSLKVKIDRRLVVTAQDIDDRDVRPYVCMDYEESAALVYRRWSASSSIEASAVILHDDNDLSFKSSEWSREADQFLVGLPIKGPVCEDHASTALLKSLMHDRTSKLLGDKSFGAILARTNVMKTIQHIESEILSENDLVENSAQLSVKIKEQMQEIYKRLEKSISSGQDINSRNKQGKTALHIATYRGHSDVLLALIHANADVQAQDKSQKSPLDLTANKRCMDVLKATGADGWTQLMIEVENGAADRVQPMIASKVDINTRNKSGIAPIYLAVQHGYTAIMNALIEAKADLNVVDLQGRSLIDVADTFIHLKMHHKHVLSYVENHHEHSCDLCNRSIVGGICYACNSCGYDMCMRCFRNQEVGCKRHLQLKGADGWTVLMIAAEHGEREVDNYFHYRDALLCIKTQSPFPDWLQKLVLHYESLQPLDWTWGLFEPSSISVSEDKLCVQKIEDSPDYSCAFGSVFFKEGFHAWSIQVENVRSMWLGIARGVDSGNGVGLGSPPGSEGEYILAFGSTDGEPISLGLSPVIQRLSPNTGFLSGQLVGFELDLNERWLKMSIDGKLLIIAENIDDQGVSPYVCMDYEESAIITSRTAIIFQVPSAIVEADRCIGFDNAAWVEKDDFFLSNLRIDAEVQHYDAMKLNTLDILLQEKLSERSMDKNSGAVATRLNILGTLNKLLLSIVAGTVDGDNQTVDQNSIFNTALHSKLKTSIYEGRDINAQNRAQCTALHIAAKNGHVRALQALIHAKADVNMLNQDGQSSLDITNDEHCADVLKAAGADGWTELIIAAEKGQAAVIRGLLAANENIAAQSRFGRTALHAAAEGNHVEATRILTDAGADVNARDRDGQTPLDLTCDTECIALLVGLGAMWSPRLLPGEIVRLSISYRRWEDSVDGPLRPGDIGTVMKDDLSDKPYLVRSADGTEWYYCKAAVVSTSASAT